MVWTRTSCICPQRRRTAMTDKESDSRSALKQPKPKRGCRARADLGCRVCHLTFRTHNVLLQHAKAHLQEEGPACGLCGERFHSAERLTLHLENSPDRDADPEPEQREAASTLLGTRYTQGHTHTPAPECGRSFLRLCRLRKHRCLRAKVQPN